MRSISFFCAKKPKKKSIRVIVECRLVSSVFTDLWGVTLCSTALLSELEICLPAHVSPESLAPAVYLKQLEMTLGMAAVCGCFHRVRLFNEFSRWVGLGVGFGGGAGSEWPAHRRLVL